MSDAATVHLVDDDESFLAAMSRLLRAEGFHTSAYASASRFLSETPPGARGCVVADLEMPDVGGLELQARLARSGIDMPMIFLTGHGDIPRSVQAMRGGAIDFLEKRSSKEAVVAAIRSALDEDVVRHAARLRRQGLERKFVRLTRREREVLRYVVRGKMNKEIAASLGINERTVKLHRTAITGKVGVHSAAQLATLAREARLFESDDSADQQD